MTCGVKARIVHRIIILLEHAPTTTKNTAFYRVSVFGINVSTIYLPETGIYAFLSMVVSDLAPSRS